MTKGKTESGFEFELNEKMLEDWDVVTIIDCLRKGQASMADINRLFEILISSEGFENLKIHVRAQNDGVVSTKAMMDELKGILSYGKAKN